MSQERLTLRKIKETLRLKYKAGLSNQARSYNMTPVRLCVFAGLHNPGEGGHRIRNMMTT